MLSFSVVTFVLFCFCLVFVFFAPSEAEAFCSIVFRSSICMRPDSHTQLPNNCLRLLPFCFFLFGDAAFLHGFKTAVHNRG